MRDDYHDEDPFDPQEWDNKYGGGGRQDFSIPPPASTYPLVIESWERRGPGTSGYEYINLAVSITSGDYEGRWIWDILSYSPKAGYRWAMLFRALGWTPAHGTIDRNDDEELSRWFDSGRPFKARTYVDSYRTTEDGRMVTKKSAKIKEYLPAESLGVPPRSEEDAGEYEPAGSDPSGAHPDNDLPF